VAQVVARDSFNVCPVDCAYRRATCVIVTKTVKTGPMNGTVKLPVDSTVSTVNVCDEKNLVVKSAV